MRTVPFEESFSFHKDNLRKDKENSGTISAVLRLDVGLLFWQWQNKQSELFPVPKIVDLQWTEDH